MCPIAYYQMIRHSKSPEYIRLDMVRFAREHGIKPAAGAFKMTVVTVRKWVRRFDGTLESLRDRSRALKNRPRRISDKLETRIVGLKKRLPSWGAERLKRDFQLPCSAKAILRVYRQHGLIRPRRRKYRVKNDLRQIKQRWALFQQIAMDTKDLFDVPEYRPAMRRFGLPRCRYTAREVVSGLVFVAYAQERSITYSAIFADLVLKHLRRCGIEPGTVRIQTDNGSEFIGSWQKRGPSGFTQMIESRHGARHGTIPPGAHTCQSDVETFHGIIEHEFFSVESFTGLEDFLAKACTYQLFFNYARANSSKGWKTPIEIIRERDRSIDPKVGLLPPVFLESLLPKPFRSIIPTHPKKGYHVWSYPYPLSNIFSATGTFKGFHLFCLSGYSALF